MIFEGEETEGTGNWRGRRGDPEKKEQRKGAEREREKGRKCRKSERTGKGKDVLKGRKTGC